MRCMVFCIVILIAATGNAKAGMLKFSFTDPVGDEDIVHGLPVVAIDVVGVDFSFDNTTGDYTIKLFADAANPFDGHFRVNVNLYNPDAGTTAVPGFFSDTGNDMSLGSPTTLVTLVGTNTNLLAWQAGHRVAIGTTAFGNPTDAWFSLFGSGVLRFVDGTVSDFDSIDYVGQDGGSNGQSTAIAVIVSENVGGSVTGMSPTTGRVTCQNLTRPRRKTVRITLPAGIKSWDCSQAGLVANPGDKIMQTITVTGPAD